MKIGVVSDTHSREISAKVWADLKGMDLIIHAGDICSRAMLDQFRKICKVEAVLGNMDDADLREELPEKQIIHVEGKAVGIYHGAGPAKKVLEFVKEKFQGDKVDVVVFGHSHIAFNETIDGVLYFNPGSPTDTLCSPYCSYGVVEIAKGQVKGKIVKL